MPIEEGGQFRNAKREEAKGHVRREKNVVESKTYCPGICQEDSSSLLQGRSYLDLNGSVERP